jgi:glycerol-3-phosphate dehydrogenase
MIKVHEPARDTPIAHECDLCVIGGGCTGVFCAVRAARLGATVALVENNGFFDGVATAGQVNVWHSIYDTVG